MPNEIARALPSPFAQLEPTDQAGAAEPIPATDDRPDPCVTLVDDADTDLSLIADFVIESREYLEAAEAALLLLDGDPNDVEAINTVFRAFHTIKGTSSFLGLDLITELAHEAESLLSRARDGEIRCTGGYAGLALRAVDVMGTLLDGVKAALAAEPAQSVAGYRMVMQRLKNPAAFRISEVERRAAWRAFRAGAVAARQAADGDRALERSAAGRSATDGNDATVRVRITTLDRLIEMVGELVIAHAMIAQDPTVRDGANLDLIRKISQVEKIVRELQGVGLSMRMVPLHTHFQKVARLVRDLASKSGKLVSFVGSGGDTEIDRTLVDILGDPLVHMVRNAVDHGIELPDTREAAGKSQTGVVRLSAYHAGGNVIVELQDDGCGLDRDRIARKAIEKGLIASDEGMSDSEVFRLIYAPGFTTAEQLTGVSGRGVGMDVVKRNIEGARGRIDIASVPGAGTKFTLRLPLTLAITNGILIRMGSDRSTVPVRAVA